MSSAKPDRVDLIKLDSDPTSESQKSRPVPIASGSSDANGVWSSSVDPLLPRATGTQEEASNYSQDIGSPAP